jgi:hypothetical protein
MSDGAELLRAPPDIGKALRTASCACDAGVEATRIAKVANNNNNRGTGIAASIRKDGGR